VGRGDIIICLSPSSSYHLHQMAHPHPKTQVRSGPVTFLGTKSTLSSVFLGLRRFVSRIGASRCSLCRPPSHHRLAIGWGLHLPHSPQFKPSFTMWPIFYSDPGSPLAADPHHSWIFQNYINHSDGFTASHIINYNCCSEAVGAAIAEVFPETYHLCCTCQVYSGYMLCAWTLELQTTEMFEPQTSLI
jgi:hypothetical protein